MAWAFTIATGPSDGSYFQIAQDIKNVAAKENIDLQVMPTKGSIENIQLLGAGKVDLAIVQLDALRFVSDVLKKQRDFDLFDSIKVILNLYPEEIHVVSNKSDIQTFYQLDGKRLSVGTEGGGTAITADRIGANTRLRTGPAPAITPHATPRPQAIAVAATISTAVNWNAARNAGPSLTAAATIRPTHGGMLASHWAKPFKICPI